MAKGIVTIDFGTGGNVLSSVDVTGMTGLSAGSFMEAFLMAEASLDNTVDAHIVAPMRIRCEYLTTSSFRIHAVSDWTLRGRFSIRWVTA